MMKTMANKNIELRKINAPYNFVPINDKVVIPGWGDKISHDLPFSDGEDGCIEVTVENLTPMITCNGRSQTDTKQAELMPAHIKTDKGNVYYLPGSGLKGMLRSVVEIMSFGKMQQYDDDFFGYRDFGTGNHYTSKFSAVKNGWLSLDPDTDEYKVEISEKYDKISHDKLKVELSLSGERWKSFKEKDAFKKAEELEYLLGEEYPRINGGILVCTGDISNKRHEYIFDEHIVGDVRLTDDDTVIKSFFSVYKPSKNYGDTKDAKRYGGEIKKRLRDGKKVPVFFEYKNGKILTMGITRMYRYPYKYSVSQLVGEEHAKAKSQLDMAECIFGCINQNGHDKALRGRVQVGNAFMTVAGGLGKAQSGVLGQPLASYYPLYIDQRGQAKLRKYNTYDTDGARIAGRKRYRVHMSIDPELPQGNGNENTMTKFIPLQKGLKFSFKIHVHNLRPVEIGALLSALTFHESKTAHHNFGLAKSFGYGKLQLDEVNLHGLAKTAKAYMQEFEVYMNENVGNWAASPQIQQLIRIASDHNCDMKMMDLDEYAYFKENNQKQNDRNNFSLLEEGSEECISLLDDEYKEAKKKAKMEAIEAQKTEIRRQIDSNDFGEARRQIDDCKKMFDSDKGWYELDQAWTERVKEHYTKRLEQLIGEKKFDDGQALIDEGKVSYPEVGCWAGLHMKLTIARNQVPTTTQEGDLTFDGYNYSSWNAFKGKIDKVKKQRGLKPEEIDNAYEFLKSELEQSNKKLKQELRKNKGAKEYLKDVLGDDSAEKLFELLK